MHTCRSRHTYVITYIAIICGTNNNNVELTADCLHDKVYMYVYTYVTM